MPQRPPLRAIITYAIGQLGWSLASFSAINLLLYFYLPPETSESTFPTFIFQGAVLGIFTIIGFVASGSRIFDAVTDPLIANWSDQSTSKFGKRKKLMGIAAIPFALLSFLVFFPISASTTVNTVWLVLIILLFYFFMTLYVVPYTALISELGHHPDDRLLISTIISVAWALGFLFGNTAFALQGLFENSMSLNPTTAFQMAMGILSGLSLLFMLIPVLFLNENKYASQSNTSIDIKASMRSVFKNVNFRYFIFSDLTYWLALTFIQIGVSYYITILFELDKSFATLFSTIGFFASFLLYVPINILAKRIGKKQLLKIAFLVFALIFILTAAVGILPIPNMVLFYVLSLLSAIPLAIFGILPNTIIADIVHEHEAQSGQQLAGMFYGVRNFMMKMGVMLSNLIFPSLLLFGKSIDNPNGIRLAAICAFVFSLIGFFIFLNYKEKPANVE